jgi:hypothetical protein
VDEDGMQTMDGKREIEGTRMRKIEDSTHSV